MNVPAYFKAFVGGLVAGLTALATGLGDNALSAQEYVTAGIAFLVGLGVVYAVPNKTD
jgi:hypothetical protein